MCAEQLTAAGLSCAASAFRINHALWVQKLSISTEWFGKSHRYPLAILLRLLQADITAEMLSLVRGLSLILWAQQKTPIR